MFEGSREEKEKVVIDLYKEGRTIREIASIMHLSFSSIGTITRKYDAGKGGNREVQPISRETQALKLFSNSKAPIDVAIQLDMDSDDVDLTYRKFWRLKRQYELASLYKEIRLYLRSFLLLSDILKDQNMLTKEGILNLVKFAQEIQLHQSEIEDLKQDIQEFENMKLEKFKEVSCLLDQKGFLEASIKEAQITLAKKILEVNNLKKVLKKHEQFINKIQNSEDNQEMEKIVEKKAKDTLLNNKILISFALISVIEALEHINNYSNNNNNKQGYYGQNVWSNGCYYGNSLFPVSEIVNYSEKLLFQNLTRIFVKDTMQYTIYDL
jgi:DNA-binding CsgD family transcriptional regulator